MEYSSMTRAELELNLKRLKSRFADLEETITFNLAYSSAHIGGGQVRKDEACLNELKTEICRIQEILTAGEHADNSLI